MLYLLCFGELNVLHTFLLIFLMLVIRVPKFSSKLFWIVLLLFCLRYFIGYCYAVCEKAEYSNYTLTRVFKIIGFYSTIVQKNALFPNQINYLIIVIFYFNYVQYWCYGYLRMYPLENLLNGPNAAANKEPGFMIKLFSLIKDILNKCALWIIYLLIIIVLAYQDTTAPIILYTILIQLIIATHIISDIKYGKRNYSGFKNTKIAWLILKAYNMLMLVVNYFICFVMYSIKLDFEKGINEEFRAKMLLAGFDFAQPTGWKLHRLFLPQFSILILGYLATVFCEAPEMEETMEVKYKSKAM